MLIVPEIKTVVVLVPRTGSGALYRTVLKTYPKAMLLYRHMEADGCPKGYDHWRRIGVVRHPLSRLWSLYQFMRTFVGGSLVQHAGDLTRIHRQVDRPFDDWLLNNVEPWTIPYDLSGSGDYWPVLERMRPAPENKISQWSYLRPDSGTEIFKFERMPDLYDELGLVMADVANGSNKGPPPELTDKTNEHLEKFCGWDLDQGCALV